MSAVYDATMSGGRAPARPRDVIGESWQRMLARGVNPDTHIPPVIEASGLDALRKSSGLLAVLDDVSRGLESIVAEGDNILVLADARGRVLWRSGSAAVLGKADRLGFVEGANWGEGAVGTNAIGTALASNRAVQVFSAEHFLRSHHAWTCAGARSATRAPARSSASSMSPARPRRCTPPPSRSSTRSPGWPKRTCASSMRGR